MSNQFRVSATRTVSEAEARRRLARAFDLILELDENNADRGNVCEAETRPARDPATSKQQDQGRLYHDTNA